MDSTEYLNGKLEIIEDTEDINIQDIDEVNIENTGYNPTPNDMKYIANKFNEIIRAVKQLDKTKEDK